MAAFIQDGQIPVVKDWFAKAVGQEHCRQNTQTVRTLESGPIGRQVKKKETND